MKLYIITEPDFGVGISQNEYEIDVPFNGDEVDWDVLEDFRKSQIEIYKEYGETRIKMALYDFEYRIRY